MTLSIGGALAVSDGHGTPGRELMVSLRVLR
jgi:hypothetical protein